MRLTRTPTCRPQHPPPGAPASPASERVTPVGCLYSHYPRISGVVPLALGARCSVCSVGAPSAVSVLMHRRRGPDFASCCPGTGVRAVRAPGVWSLHSVLLWDSLFLGSFRQVSCLNLPGFSARRRKTFLFFKFI